MNTSAPSHESDLERRLAEANATISALLSGEIDAVISPASSTPVLLAEAQDVLRESETRFRQLAENLDQVFVLRDPRVNRVLYVNPAYERVFGRSCESLYNAPRSWLELVHPEDRVAVGEAVGPIGTAAAFNIEFRITRPDGVERNIHSRGCPVRDEQDAICRVAVMIDDVTDRKHLESQMLQARKMDAVGRLAAGIAHDFNNLLAVIMGHGEMLAADTVAGDPRSESIDEVIGAARRASQLTRQLLTFSRQQPIALKVVAANDAVTAITGMLRSILGEEIEVKLDLNDMTDGILVDAGQFEQVLVNLAVNARDAMPRGGTLTFRTTSRAIDAESTAFHGLDQPGRYVVIEVSDTGSGMTPQTLARVFEPFFTTKGPGKGTGLGLATAFGVVTQSGGRIAAYSELGLGTTFRIFLPSVATDGMSRPDVTAEKMPGGTETILLVEDDDAVRAAVTRMIRRLGYNVLTAESGPDALALAADPGLLIDLLITDVIMPGMDGPTLVSAFSSERAHVRALMISGYAGDIVAERCTGDSVGIATIQKPFSLTDLAQHIRAVLDAP